MFLRFRKILINVQKDSNGNKRFDEKDDIISMEYSLDTQKAPVVFLMKIIRIFYWKILRKLKFEIELNNKYQKNGHLSVL